ncbi:helix-turn-helix domain-containing protein [Xenorhabdus sp. XENO-1]|uniref:phage repressor protein CI n=1 Tax=Xenorhabdus bovienii TaxID=40576 RepID=UPI0020CA395F|nr:phage repressor protein CI [Xenorhabdus bovienii]MCP9267817.1 helix-turn-helix domain-containing protein [Xenorhabdus bovienii subsp. africana]
MNKNQKFSFPEVSATALDRIMEAYGFSTKLQLAKHYNMAASSLSARYTRNIFPADMVLQCALETGTDINWLTFGFGKGRSDEKLDLMKITRYKLNNGKLLQSGFFMLDKISFTSDTIPATPISVVDGSINYIIDKDFPEIHDGEWLVDIEGKISIRELTRIPVKRVRVSGVGMAFDCDLSDIEVIGRVVTTIKNHI